MRLQGLDRRIGMNWIWLKWLIKLILAEWSSYIYDLYKLLLFKFVTVVTEKSYKTHIPLKDANKNSEGKCV